MLELIQAAEPQTMGIANQTVRREKSGFFANYGLSLVLASLFFVSLLGQAWFQYQHELSMAREHATVLVRSDYITAFLASVLENWQSEFLQLLCFVFLTTFLYHKGSPESRDSEERLAAAVSRIERRLDRLGAPVLSAQDKYERERFEEEIEESRRMISEPAPQIRY